MGFRIYRTINTPGSDARLAAALRALSEYMHQEIYRDSEASQHRDDIPSDQIWQRMEHEVVEDMSTLNKVSPTAIQQHFQAWIESTGIENSASSRHRSCIVVDSEVVQNLLRLSLPSPLRREYKSFKAVKTLYVECTPDSTDYEPPYHEGWL